MRLLPVLLLCGCAGLLPQRVDVTVFGEHGDMMAAGDGYTGANPFLNNSTGESYGVALTAVYPLRAEHVVIDNLFAMPDDYRVTMPRPDWLGEITGKEAPVVIDNSSEDSGVVTEVGNAATSVMREVRGDSLLSLGVVLASLGLIVFLIIKYGHKGPK